MAETRGRKSAADRQVVNLVTAVAPQRPGVPEDFRDGSYEALLWRRIVDENVADWFKDADLPLLEAYCRTAANHRRVSDEAYSEPFTVTGAQGGVIANPIFAIQNGLSRAMASLSVKLRLSHSSRMTSDVANTRHQRGSEQSRANGTTGGRPWDAKQ